MSNRPRIWLIYRPVRIGWAGHCDTLRGVAERSAPGDRKGTHLLYDLTEPALAHALFRKALCI
jgi:hypothetical protein